VWQERNCLRIVLLSTYALVSFKEPSGLDQELWIRTQVGFWNGRIGTLYCANKNPPTLVLLSTCALVSFKEPSGLDQELWIRTQVGFWNGRIGTLYCANKNPPTLVLLSTCALVSFKEPSGLDQELWIRTQVGFWNGRIGTLYCAKTRLFQKSGNSVIVKNFYFKSEKLQISHRPRQWTHSGHTQRTALNSQN